MSITRPFAYNTGPSIAGTIQVGNIAVGGTATGYGAGLGGLKWWNGPDETLGYIICNEVLAGNQPNPESVPAYIGFKRSSALTEASFIQLSNSIPGSPGDFASGVAAKAWLNTNGYWTSYLAEPISTGLIVKWDIQQNSSYGGSGTTITDLVGNSNGNMTGTISYTSGSPSTGIPNYLTVEGGGSEYIYTATELNPFLSPVNTGTSQSVFLWIYPTTNGIIISEQGSLIPDSSWFDVQIQRNSSGQFLYGVWPYSLNSPQITSSASFPLNNWYYVGWTFSGSTLTGYVNGISVGTATVSRHTPYNNGGGAPLYLNIGYPSTTKLSASTSASTFRLGAMNIYNIGISGSDVLTNFNNTKSSYGL